MNKFKCSTGNFVFSTYGIPSKFCTGDKFKDKSQYPYSYDPVCIWGDEDSESNGSVYTDRLFQWDPVKYNELCQKHFGNCGQYWNERDPELIEAFMRDWNDNPKLKLTYITEFCNASNGYPTWLLAYNNG